MSSSSDGYRLVPPSPAFRILVLGDFGLPDVQAPGDAAAPESVTAARFAEVLALQDSPVSIDVTNHLSGRPERLPIDLRFTSPKDLTPAGIAAQVPLISTAVALLERLRGLSAGRITPADLEEDLAASHELTGLAEPLRLCREAMASKPMPPAGGGPAKPAPGAESDDDLDRLLDLVELPTRPDESPPASQRFIAGIGSQRSRTAVPAVSAAVALAEEVVAQQVSAILHHPLVRARARAWLGLKFLIDRTDARAPVRIEIVDASRDRIDSVFREAAASPAPAQSGDDPVALVIAAIEVENTPMDMDLLRSLARVGEAIQAPVLISMGRGFLGLPANGGDSEPPAPDELLAGPRYLKWNGLRDAEEARWITLCFNRFLLASPFFPDPIGSLGLNDPGTQDGQIAWGDPVWAVASLITTSVARTDWPTEITGKINGRIGDLPVRRAADAAPWQRHGPVETPIPSEQEAHAFAKAGIAVLLGRRDADAAYLLEAPTLYRPKRYDDIDATRSSWLMAQMPYQLLAARLASAVAHQCGMLPAGMAPEDLVEHLRTFLLDLIAGTGDGAAVLGATEPAPGSGDRLALAIRLGRNVLGGAEVRLEFGV